MKDMSKRILLPGVRIVKINIGSMEKDVPGEVLEMNIVLTA